MMPMQNCLFDTKNRDVIKIVSLLRRQGGVSDLDLPRRRTSENRIGRRRASLAPEGHHDRQRLKFQMRRFHGQARVPR